MESPWLQGFFANLDNGFQVEMLKIRILRIRLANPPHPPRLQKIMGKFWRSPKHGA